MTSIVMFTPVTGAAGEGALSASRLGGTGSVFLVRFGWSVLAGGSPGTAMDTPSSMALVVKGAPVTRVSAGTIPAVFNVCTGTAARH